MKHLLMRITCKHKMMPYASYYETRSDGHMCKKHVFKCTKCGKERW